MNNKPAVMCLFWVGTIITFVAFVIDLECITQCTIISSNGFLSTFMYITAHQYILSRWVVMEYHYNKLCMHFATVHVCKSWWVSSLKQSEHVIINYANMLLWACHYTTLYDMLATPPSTAPDSKNITTC